ncbi:large subunit GTPase 1 homolog [Agrilus planipennis]|uniref:Large subunit GTPase 1 homolog n=1 Tax=Agrilus planipennis TaxID=224129 RepID=A0A1W4W3Z7_AGRPL|nr:large subunit GTPase 1 homolog [Agrilus planipennis]XP_025830107.1 large subunit GTPase 1 homolog [Agrilus planipennis]
MGKKNKSNSSLGKSLVRDRFRGRNGKFVADKSMLHTTELLDGYDWGRLNLQSVTEESSFQEFLSTAELAGTEFQAEKLNITFVNPKSNVGLLSDSEKMTKIIAHEKHKHLIQIPRRPFWTPKMSAEELQCLERDNFLKWRRSLAELQEEEGLLLTPFEKNLEFWRQLWRVIEKSDVIVQIVDARNPLLFRCEDLENYVKDISEDKVNLILINKADFLTKNQREIWAKYFESVGIRIAFFSAIIEEKKTNKKTNEDKNETQNNADLETTNVEILKLKVGKLEENVDKAANALSHIINKVEKLLNKPNSSETISLEKSDTVKNLTSHEDNVIINNNGEATSECINILTSRPQSPDISNSPEILTREELIQFFKVTHSGKKVTEGLTTIGMVGYPNVGKSSTINNLMTVKKVSVSATPGKTKHFQTLFLDKDILLCDCPGLVMPSFVFTKAEMIINGILPIDQMRDHVPPINLICNLIPRHILEDKYGLMLPKPLEGEDPERPPFAEELLNAYGYNRGFMTANGQPDNPRAARYILKDFVNGKLLFAHAPPNVNQNEYQIWPQRKNNGCINRTLPPRQARAIRSNRITSEDLDNSFFYSKTQGLHVKGQIIPNIGANHIIREASLESQQSLRCDKPWKKINKYENKKKREKLRRVYAHLDEH